VFVVTSFEGIMYLIFYGIHPIEIFYCCRRGELVIIVEVSHVRVEAIESFIRGEFIGCGGISIISKLSIE